MTTATPTQPISLATLPALGEDFEGGTFAGITTRKDGTHCAVTLLPEKTTDVTWKKATTWATKQGGELPTRPVAALLLANCKPHLKPVWHWSSETHESDASYAWYCYFSYGGQSINRNSYEGSAVAVRRI